MKATGRHAFLARLLIVSYFGISFSIHLLVFFPFSFCLYIQLAVCEFGVQEPVFYFPSLKQQQLWLEAFGWQGKGCKREVVSYLSTKIKREFDQPVCCTISFTIAQKRPQSFSLGCRVTCEKFIHFLNIWINTASVCVSSHSCCLSFSQFPCYQAKNLLAWWCFAQRSRLRRKICPESLTYLELGRHVLNFLNSEVKAPDGAGWV